MAATVTVKPNYPWTRFWCPRGDNIQVSHHGYLIDPESEVGKYANQNLVPLSALLTTRCLVLLGEAGIGKSTELETLDTANAESDTIRSLHLDLGEYGSEETLVADVFQCPTFREWLAGSHLLSIFFDSLDEAILEIPKVKSILERGLRGAPTERLRFRIACRTAAWPESLTSSLESLFGPDNVALCELAPLRQCDVRDAARSERVDADEFIVQVEARGVAPLATNPTTLRLLVEIFREQQALPNSLVDLYDRGLRALCSPSESRRDRNRAPAISIAQTVETATRIASYSILTGRPTVYSGPESQSRKTDLVEDEIVGGRERADGAEFEVTPAAIRTALRETGLFTSRGPHRLGFAHKTYGEYLAARYLHNAGLPAAQMEALLFVPGENPPRVIPQLQEVAAWLASFSPEFFDMVALSEPEVLLQSDVTARDHDRKRRLVQSLLERVDRRELSWSQVRELRPFLHRLHHTTLAEQVRTTVTDGTQQNDTRRVAIDIADASDLRELADLLADLALDQSLEQNLRVRAAYAVINLDEESACERMKPLALGEAGNDPDDELRGCGLRATWPRFLTVDELLQCLTPERRSNLVGSYQMFLHHASIGEQIPDADLALALDWANARHRSGSLDPLSRLAGQFAYRALGLVEDTSVRLPLVRLIIQRVKADSHDIFVHPKEGPHFGERHHKPPVLGTEERHLILEAFVTEHTVDDLTDVIYCGFDFVIPEDLEWTLQRAATTEADDQAKWIRLASCIFSPYQPDHLETWHSYKERCDSIRKLLPWPEAVDLQSTVAEEMREQQKTWERRRTRQANLSSMRNRLDPPARERVKIALNRCLSGEAELFWFLLDQLRLKDDEPHGLAILPESMYDHPGWQAANDESRRLIVEAARRYLRDAALDPTDPFQRDEQYVADRAPALAIQLLLINDEAFLASLDESRWELMAPFLLIAPVGTAENRKESAKHAYRKAPAAFRGASIQLVERSRSATDIGLTSMFDDCPDDRLASAVVAFLRREDCSKEVFLTLLGWLVRSGFSEARDFAQSLVTPPRFAQNQVPRLCPEAAVALIVFDAETSWDAVWATLEQNTGLAHRVFRQIAHEFDRRKATVAGSLNEQQLGELIQWLFKHYSPSSDPIRDGAHIVGPDENVRHWRDALLNQLAGLGTPAACSELQTLRDANLRLPWLHDVLLDAQRTRRRVSWMPPSPTDLRMLVQDHRRRYVSTGSQLLDLVEESLDRYSEELHGTTPSVRNLWDQSAAGDWRPKNEAHLSDNVASHLRRDLGNRAVVVNREVEVRARQSSAGAPGQETDIHVNAVSRGTVADVTNILTVIIEVKGCWNREIEDAMKTQLVDRYLSDNQCQQGIYLVGWFMCDAWEDADYRKKDTPWESRDEAEQELRVQAAQLTSELATAADVRAYVLDSALR